MIPTATPDAIIDASFRDPGGSVLHHRERILRIVNPSGLADWRALADSPAARPLLDTGAIVPTRTLDDAETHALLRENDGIRSLYHAIDGRLILEHERIEFPSFPYEWPPEMLHAAGVLTLDLAESLLHDGLGLKDATPYNILFRGPQPVFADLLSFETRTPGDPTWLPYAQFVRTFLLPLLANRTFGLPLDSLLTTRRDGLEPEELYRLASFAQRLRPPFLGLVSLPTWLGGNRQKDSAIYQQKLLPDPAKARFVLGSILRSLRRSLTRLTPPAGKTSVWTDYMSANNNYTTDHFQAKQAFVAQALQDFPSPQVLDVGCNTGHFSAIAARAGAKVVAIDYDPVVLGDVWRAARSSGLNILPLAVNLTRPTPATGWRNRECPGFLDRARGSFDAVMMLAVIHHMLVTERIPLDRILELASELIRGSGILIVEYVGPDDSMFRRLTRGRDHLHAGLSTEVFETLCRRHFDIVRSQRVEGTARSLYLLKKRAA